MRAVAAAAVIRWLLLAAPGLAGAPCRAEGAAYAVDPTHTFVVFEVDHAATSTLRGRFDRSEGTVTLDRGARTGRIDIHVASGSLDTGVPALDAALRGPDFLDAGAHPALRFVAERIDFDGERVAAVTGVLTLRGHSAPLTLQAERFGCYTNPLLRREVCGGDFNATVLRSRWGMTHGLDAGVPDAVRLRIQVEAIRQ